jgi:hypothetical protein
MDTVQVTYKILAENVAPLRKLVERLNKKAAKLDVEPILLVTSKPYNVTNEDGVTVSSFVDATVNGVAPKLNGWTFAATLQHSEDGNILRTVPGLDVDLPEEFRTSDPSRCDQCHINRYRIDTYVVKHDDGRWAQVGSTCLRDFLGHKNPHAIAAMAEWMSLIREAAEGMSEGGGWAYGAPSSLLLSEALAYVAESVIRSGWVSRGKAKDLDKRASADAALDAMESAAKGRGCGRGCRYDKPCDVHFTPSEQAIALTDTALEWGREWIEKRLAKDPDNDYVWNLRVSLAGDTVPIRSFGIAASLIGVYQNEQARLAKERAAAANTTSEWIGEIGGKIELDVCVESVRYLDGAYGTTTLINYRDSVGNVFVWFGSGYKDVKPGDTIRIKGTIKGHDEFRGVKQTTLTRVKVM